MYGINYANKVIRSEINANGGAYYLCTNIFLSDLSSMQLVQ